MRAHRAVLVLDALDTDVGASREELLVEFRQRFDRGLVIAIDVRESTESDPLTL